MNITKNQKNKVAEYKLVLKCNTETLKAIYEALKQHQSDISQKLFNKLDWDMALMEGKTDHSLKTLA